MDNGLSREQQSEDSGRKKYLHLLPTFSVLNFRYCFFSEATQVEVLLLIRTRIQSFVPGSAQLIRLLSPFSLSFFFRCPC